MRYVSSHCYYIIRKICATMENTYVKKYRISAAPIRSRNGSFDSFFIFLSRRQKRHIAPISDGRKCIIIDVNSSFADFLANNDFTTHLFLCFSSFVFPLCTFLRLRALFLHFDYLTACSYSFLFVSLFMC
jgi:hypothetical protein